MRWSRYRDDPDLAAALRALRPAPRPAFAAELDARAAAGFPRRWRWRDSALAGDSPTRLARHSAPTAARPAGACAVAAVVVATAVVAVTEAEPDARDPSTATTLAEFESHPPALRRSRPRAARQNRRSQASPAQAHRRQRALRQRQAPRSGVQLSAQPPLGRSSSGPYARRQTGARSSARPRSCSAPTPPRSAPTPPRSSTPSTLPTASSCAPRSATATAGEAGADVRPADPHRQARRRARRLLRDRRGPLPARGDPGHHRPDRQRRRAPAGLPGEDRGAARPARRAPTPMPSATAVEAELRRERRRVAALRSRLTTLQRPRQLLACLAADRDRRGRPLRTEGDSGSWGVGDAARRRRPHPRRRRRRHRRRPRDRRARWPCSPCSPGSPTATWLRRSRERALD